MTDSLKTIREALEDAKTLIGANYLIHGEGGEIYSRLCKVIYVLIEHEHARMKERTKGMTFNKERMTASPDYPKMQEMIYLLIECRDALPAINMTSAKLYGIDLTLASRIKDCLQPWEIAEGNPDDK